MLRILHSRSVAEADTEAAVVVVPTAVAAVVVSMEEVEAEAASTVAAVEADSMEVVAAERIAAEAVACTAAAVRRVTLLALWVLMDVAAAACMAADDRMARMVERVRTA